MSAALRRTGVNVLGDMPWGSHICMFYQSNEDLLDTVVPYFKAGLESNEFCLWAPSEPVTVEDARRVLSRSIPAFDRHLAAGKMEIFSGTRVVSRRRSVRPRQNYERLVWEIARRVGQRL